MKKFLTVLLVIAVMFTFSFGSAFAAVPDATGSGDYVITEAKVLENINKAYAEAQKKLEKTLTGQLDSIFTEAGNKVDNITVDGIKVYRTDVEKVYKDALYDAQVKALELNKSTVTNAVAEAIGNAKNYNGNFVIPTGIGSSTNDNVAAWNEAGYAAYKDEWGEVSKYFTTAIGNAVASTAYETVFKVNNSASPTHSGTKDADVAKASYTRVKEAAEKAINEISAKLEENYSKEYNGAAQSNFDKASIAVKAALRLIDEAAPAATPDWSAYKTSIDKINDVYTAPVNQGNPGGTLYTWPKGTQVSFADHTTVEVTGLNNIPSTANATTDAAKLEWAKNKVLGAMTEAINTRLNNIVTAQDAIILDQSLKGAKADATKIADATKAKEDAQKQASAAKEITEYLVKDCKKIEDLIQVADPFSASTALVDTTISGSHGKWAYDVVSGAMKAPNFKTSGTATSGQLTAAEQVDVINHIADLKEDADLAKATIQIDGTTLVEIEDALTDAIDKTYKGDLNARLSVGDAIEALYNRQNKLIDNTDHSVKVNGREYKTVEAWDDTLIADYDKDYYDAVRKVITETKDAIKATATIADADAAFLKGFEALDAIPTKADKRAAQATKEFRDLQKQYNSEIDAYVDYKADVISKGTTTYEWLPSTMKTKLKEKLADAYTVDALKEAYTAARAEVDNLKTKAELEAAAKAISDKIAALPTTATVADKETVDAVRAEVKAHNKYCDLIGNNINEITLYAKLASAESAIKKAEIKAMKDAYDAIMKDNKVTTDEAAAVADLRKAYDAFVTGYAGENATPTEINNLKTELTTTNGINIDRLENKLEDAQVQQVIEMLAKLPADGSDIAAVKAARAAYDALSRDAKMRVYDNAYYYDKLINAEKMVGKSVTSLKIKASSKAKKGSITVKWTVKGDASVAEGYQVWKSTKANKGYKKAITTKKTSYKNTKNLKKGKTYYYKVRAYATAADGTVYYSDWSNKAYRKAK